MANEGSAFHDDSLVGFAQTLHLLRDEKIQQFIAEVRSRAEFQFEHPDTREAYQRNLDRLGASEEERQAVLLELAKEAMKPAAEYWIEAFKEDQEDLEAPEEWAIVAQGYKLESPEKAMRAAMQFFGRGIGYLARESGVVIAQYIVAGFMEVPKAVGIPSGFVTRFPLGNGGDMILAMVTSFSDLPAVYRRMKKLYSDLFVRGERKRLPDKARETMWLRYCAYVAGHDAEIEAGKYSYLAELHFELHPKDRPPGEPLDETYERGVERHGWRIRKNSKNWEEYRDYI